MPSHIFKSIKQLFHKGTKDDKDSKKRVKKDEDEEEESESDEDEEYEYGNEQEYESDDDNDDDENEEEESDEDEEYEYGNGQEYESDDDNDDDENEEEESDEDEEYEYGNKQESDKDDKNNDDENKEKKSDEDEEKESDKDDKNNADDDEEDGYGNDDDDDDEENSYIPSIYKEGLDELQEMSTLAARKVQKDKTEDDDTKDSINRKKKRHVSENTDLSKKTNEEPTIENTFGSLRFKKRLEEVLGCIDHAKTQKGLHHKEKKILKSLFDNITKCAVKNKDPILKWEPRGNKDPLPLAYLFSLNTFLETATGLILSAYQQLKVLLSSEYEDNNSGDSKKALKNEINSREEIASVIQNLNKAQKTLNAEASRKILREQLTTQKLEDTGETVFKIDNNPYLRTSTKPNLPKNLAEAGVGDISRAILRTILNVCNVQTALASNTTDKVGELKSLTEPHKKDADWKLNRLKTFIMDLWPKLTDVATSMGAVGTVIACDEQFKALKGLLDYIKGLKDDDLKPEAKLKIHNYLCQANNFGKYQRTKEIIFQTDPKIIMEKIYKPDYNEDVWKMP